MPPIYFVSYARDDATAFFDGFHDQLVESVRIKAAVAREGTAFLDRAAVPIGAEWPRALIDALQGCRVFVPILTRSYFTREACGKEWALFRARQEAAAPGGARPPLVIPVLWGALRDVRKTAPADVLELDFDAADFPPEYAQYGLETLMRQKRFEDARAIVIEGLARRIQDAADAYDLPPLDVAPRFDELPALFPLVAAQPAAPGAAPEAGPTPAGPRFVEFVLVAGAQSDFDRDRRRNRIYYGTSPLEWCPYRPDVDRPAGILAQQVAADQNLYTLPTLPDEELEDRLRRAQERNTIVVLLVDTWTLHIQRYQEILSDFDEKNYANTAVLVIWNANDDETVASEAALEEMVRATFFYRAQGANPGTFVRVRNVDEFRRDLAEALETARRRMREYADVRRPVRFTPRPSFSTT